MWLLDLDLSHLIYSVCHVILKNNILIFIIIIIVEICQQCIKALLTN